MGVKESYWQKGNLYVRFEGTDKEFSDYMLRWHGIDFAKCKETRWSRFRNWLCGTPSAISRLKQLLPPETP
jgi:hypothetical protein